MKSKTTEFLGALLILCLAFVIFFTLMAKPIPKDNREILIAFVATLFVGMGKSIEKIIGNGKEK